RAGAAGAGSLGSHIPLSKSPPASLNPLSYPLGSNTKGQCSPPTRVLPPSVELGSSANADLEPSCGAPVNPFGGCSPPVRRAPWEGEEFTASEPEVPELPVPVRGERPSRRAHGHSVRRASTRPPRPPPLGWPRSQRRGQSP